MPKKGGCTAPLEIASSGMPPRNDGRDPETSRARHCFAMLAHR